MWRQSYFWFIQPSSVLNNYDYYFLWFFVVVSGLGIIFKVAGKFQKNEVFKKLFKKYGNLGLTIGLLGLFWFGLRYESTPIFSNRYWAALIIIGLIVWKIVLLKYLIFDFPKEKMQFDKARINSKYIPTKK